MNGLAAHLAGLSEDGVAQLLARRPDALSEPTPGTLAALASRLSTGPSTLTALEQLDAGAVTLTQALQALGDGCRRQDVLDLVSRPGTPARAEAERALAE